MTQSVVRKTSMPEKTWRRQTDSPFGWIAFSCGSVILHLLAFWLISSYKLSVSQSSYSSAVAIDFIEISPKESSTVKPKSQPQLKPKAASSKPIKPVVPQKPQPAAAKQSAVEPPVSREDSDAIGFNNQKIEQQLQQKLAEQQLEQELLQKQQLAEQQRQLQAEELQRKVERLRQRQAQQRELEAQIRQQEQEQQRVLDEKLRQQEAEQQRQLQAQKQQEAEQQRQLQAQKQQEAEQQRQLQAQKQQEAEQQRQLQEQQSENLGEKILNSPQDAQGKEPPPEFDKKTAQAPIVNQPSQNSGILTANWNIDNSFTPKKDIPDNPPQLKQNISQSFVIPPSTNSNFESVDFEVYLIINEEGYVEFAQVADIEMRRQYQTYVDQNLVNKQLFLPATDIDPRTGEVKPRRGESLIRIKIQQAS
ncbi:MAG: hypothetical protein SWZ49_01305 [Cyanobacteriota bacterium]|nr:hypothetical protein [Cyanobacteriota bacterium]